LAMNRPRPSLRSGDPNGGRPYIGDGGLETTMIFEVVAGKIGGRDRRVDFPRSSTAERPSE
jgi:hypothetical protein